jgi:large subunit ribosomal protein L3
MHKFPGLLGKKIGMTQIFDNHGNVVPVTVIQAGPCPVVQVKTEQSDGYNALQLGFGDGRRNLTKPLQGHFKKANVKPTRLLREFRTEQPPQYKPGDVITVEVLDGVEKVDVTGVSKGRGFAGMIKRHGAHRGPESHGSMNVRAPGSIGCSAFPSRVIKGKRMPGHYGAERLTVQNLKLVKINKDKNLILVKGAVPGPAGGYVLVTKAKKASK